MSLPEELRFLDATEQAALVRRGEITARELTEAAIGRIEADNSSLNAVVGTDFERALDAAEQVDRDAPFAGVPFLVKDMAAEVEGWVLTEGSRFLRDNVSPADCELVARFRAAGLVLLGKTNTPEFAMMPTTEPRLFGATRNPWDLGRSPGGSSGGSAAAVAAGMVAMAHANDGGGSIRVPAGCCGLFGLKPTRGRNSLAPRYGDVAGGLLSEHAVTRSVRDSARLLDLTCGPAAGEPYPAPPMVASFAEALSGEPGPLRIAYSTDTLSGIEAEPEVAEAVAAAARRCESLGHHLEEAAPSVDGTLVAKRFGLAWVSFVDWNVRYWARVLGREPEAGSLEPATWRSCRAARRLTPGEYLLAVTDLQTAGRALGEFFERYDAWLTPTTARSPAPLGYFDLTDRDGLLERIGQFTHHTLLANVTGQPAMSVPLGTTAGGLPLGVHFTGRYGDERTLLGLAAQLEAAEPWAGRRPARTQPPG